MKWHVQLSRYAVVGLASNAVAYVLYLLLTHLGLGHKLAMSILYGIGVLQTFIFNKAWSFRFEGAATPAFLRYVMIYVIGYAINFLTLSLLVDTLGLPHQLVMAGLVIFMAVFFFAGQKLWVFREIPAPKGTDFE
jgi:putative flippase GtrA